MTPIQRSSTFRTPTWRWERAAELWQKGGQPDPDDDAYVRAALDYQQAISRAGTEDERSAVGRRMPVVAAAHQLHRADSEVINWHLRARLLTEQTIPQIAVRLGQDLAVIETFEALFFNVRSEGSVARDGGLPTDGVAPWDPADPPIVVLWMYAAAGGGAAILDVLVAEHCGDPEPAMPDRSLAVAKLRLGFQVQFTPSADTEAWRRILRQAWTFLRSSIKDREPTREEQMLALQLQTLGMAYGIEPKKTRVLKAPSRRSGKQAVATAK